MNSSATFIRRQWIGRTTAFISILGSCAIIFDICKTWFKFKKRNSIRSHQKVLKESTSAQIILLMSIMDLVYTFFSFFIASIMTPKGTAYLSFGNDASCTAQGFIISLFAFTGIIYNAVLALYFLLTVRFGWKEKDFHTKCSQFWFFAVPFLGSLALSVWTLLEGAFNPSFGQCYVEKAPYLCETPAFPDVKCTQGMRANEINIVGSIIILMCFLMISTSMIILCWFAFRTENASNRHIFNGECNARNESQNIQRRNREKSRIIARIGILYAGCFILSYLPYIVITFFFTNKDIPSWLFYTMFVLAPLQGFFNALVYYYRKQFKKKNRKTNYSSKISNRGSAKDPKSLGTSYNLDVAKEINKTRENDIESSTNANEEEKSEIGKSAFFLED